MTKYTKIAMHWSLSDYAVAFTATIENEYAIKNSTQVACYHCLKVMSADQVVDYTPDFCAICPLCQVDALVPDHSQLPINDIRYLEHMHWFGFDRVHLQNGCITTRFPHHCLDCWMSLDDVISEYVWPDQTYDIQNYQVTSEICPFEVEAVTSHNRSVYVKQRWSVLRIEVDGLIVYYNKNIQDFDGIGDLVKLTSVWFHWPL